MNLTTIVAAFKTRWDAANVGNTITGGLHAQNKVSDGTSLPYATIAYEDDVVQFRTSISASWHERYDRSTVRIRIYSNGGAEALGTLAETLEEAFDGAELSVVGGTIYRCSLLNQGLMPEEHPNGMHWVQNYEVIWSRAMRKTAS